MHRRYHINHHRHAEAAGALAVNTAGRGRKLRAHARWIAGVSLVIACALLAGAFGLAKLPQQANHAVSPFGSFRSIHLAAAVPQPAPAIATPEPVQPQPTPPAPKPRPKPAPVASATTSITIKGDDKCRIDTNAALQLLAAKAPTHYARVTTYISIIECAAQGSGMAAYENPPRYIVGDATRNAGTIWYAGTIAHDAIHSKLYNEYQRAHPNQVVPSDVWTGRAAEATCLDAQYAALKAIGADQATLDYVQNSINSDYWDIPYDQRNW